MKKVVFGFVIVLIFCNATTAFSKEVPFTLEDRDRIIRLEAKLDFMDIDNYLYCNNLRNHRICILG